MARTATDETLRMVGDRNSDILDPAAWKPSKAEMEEAERDIHHNNPSGISPTEFNVVVLPDDIESETLKDFKALQASGFKLDENTKDRHQFAGVTGRLIAASPLAFGYEHWPDGARKPQVGERVLIAKFSGLQHKGRDGKDYRVVKDKDLVAILD